MKQFVMAFFSFIGLISFSVILAVLACLLDGLVLSYLWEWFIVPLGIKPLGILHAIGLNALVGFATHHYYEFKKSDDVGILEPLSWLFVRPLATWGFGYCVHLLMPYF